MAWKFLLISCIFGIGVRIVGSGCIVPLRYANKTLQDHQPLILLRTGGSYNFLYPKTREKELTLEVSTNLIASCPGTQNYIKGIPDLKLTDEIEITCIKDTTFISKGRKFDVQSVSCNHVPVHGTRRSKAMCLNHGSLIEIGFQLKQNFLPTLEVCRDDETLSTFYTKFFLSKHIAAAHKGFPRPSKWKSGEFYGRQNLDRLYNAKSQARTLAKLLKSEELANEYIDSFRTRFLARGHLTAKADFVYGSAQMTTFWYLNAAPQWQSFNGGNWNWLEDNVRKFADAQSLDLIVYTGTHGQMTLPDRSERQVHIYLSADDERYRIPVPRFFWKIMYDPERMLGTAFVGVNNPYAKNITADMFICKDVSDRIAWLTRRRGDIKKGVTYACDVNDLKTVVQSAPKLAIKGLLF